MGTNTPIDSESVRALATLLDETNLTEIEYSVGDTRIRVVRNIQTVAVQAAPVFAAPAAAAPAAAAGASEADHPGAVPSPMVGVAYLAPEPGAAKFVNPGDIVSEGQTLMLIEAMKTFNPIRAPRGGKVSRMLVSDGQPVEFGEPLLIIE